MIAKIFSLIDLTSLNDNDTEETIRTLCQKAVTPLGQVAAVCVYPQFVKVAKNCLPNTIPVAAVANFPRGDESLVTVMTTMQQAIDAGATEIDLVFPHQLYRESESSASEFIQACKKTCETAKQKIILKVILESGAMTDSSTLAAISSLVIAAGADFLKTSTGKIPQGATIEAAAIMLQAIKESHQPVGFKVSGGVRTLDQACEYISLAEKIMGSNWVTAKYFRIGASSLVDTLIN